MSTFLFDKIIFGPVNSRRLGVSLGINLLPTDRKICSFNCIYCECGLNPSQNNSKSKLPTRNEVAVKLKLKLKEMQSEGVLPDVITFAGNGEPTLHPEFAGIIDDTVTIRNEHCPKARIAVLSNASRLHKEDVFSALLKIDDNIQKLDSGLIETIQTLDRPNYPMKLNDVVTQLKRFNGQVIIQTMFIKGDIEGTHIDNTTEENIAPWLELLKIIKPGQVMIYTIERDTPFDSLHKVSLEELQTIATRVRAAGFDVAVSG
ncbi:radical SAM protein [Marinilabiliaceae bacterium JC017]|nr:radical SAM protein [Marinilabiliaceae bacterium JC017]